MAQVDYYLKLDTIDGESTRKGFEKWIELDSFSWGVTNQAVPRGGGGAGAGKATFQDFHFVARTGVQSPVLLQSCAAGQHFLKVMLGVVSSGERTQDFLKIRLQDVLVSSYQVGGSDTGEDGRPSDQFSLNFTKIEMDVFAQNAAGANGKVSHGGWDLKTNSKI